MSKVICRFSCGAASAVATKLALRDYPDAVIAYNDTGSEHPDNQRFLKDCEKWFGRSIQVLRSKHYRNTLEVFKARRFLTGASGAPCTGELKRIPGESIWKPGDVEVFGYTNEEANRVERFKRDNPERVILTPLIEAGLSKGDCFGFLDRAGIDLPEMYKLGFKNNNCIGCVKARDSINYWKRVRKYFPEQYNELAQLEREIGFSINRRSVKGQRVPVFLDDIPEGDPEGPDGVNISCGLFCMSEHDKA